MKVLFPVLIPFVYLTLFLGHETYPDVFPALAHTGTNLSTDRTGYDNNGPVPGYDDRVYPDDVMATAHPAPPDTDNDGIPDDVDLDDDNDGITDEEEYCTTTHTAFLASQNTHGNRTVVINHTGTGYLRLDFDSMNSSFQLDINGTTIHPSIMESDNNAWLWVIFFGRKYIRFESDNAFINSPWTQNTNGLPRLRIIVDESGNVALYGSRTTSSTSLEPMRVQSNTPFNTINWIPGSNNVFTITNYPGSGQEGFSGELFASTLCDSDGDGVINSLDLDSDNDGIYDIVESGVLDVSGIDDADNDGRIDGDSWDFGNNGLHIGLENNDTEVADLTYTIADSDSDGIYNPFDTDSDNDACNDVREAGYPDDNGDGILGTLPTITDSDGLVTGTGLLGGYTTPNDNDSNGVYDFLEVSPLPTITLHPTSTIICPGCSTTFSVAATNTTSYQWQVFDGTNWVDLTDTGIYSGTSTDILSVTGVAPDDNGNLYRAILANTAYACSTPASNTATLTIRAKTVITNRKVTYRVDKN
ncbi:MAG: hypothetical protein CR994_07890 [Maribacter sp.]|nr:MAG: hypothetical protein CR994_07890 [Maribacter sp.]